MLRRLGHRGVEWNDESSKEAPNGLTILSVEREVQVRDRAIRCRAERRYETHFQGDEFCALSRRLVRLSVLELSLIHI